jgi:hypothetical protein
VLKERCVVAASGTDGSRLKILPTIFPRDCGDGYSLMYTGVLEATSNFSFVVAHNFRKRLLRAGNVWA